MGTDKKRKGTEPTIREIRNRRVMYDTDKPGWFMYLGFNEDIDDLLPIMNEQFIAWFLYHEIKPWHNMLPWKIEEPERTPKQAFREYRYLRNRIESLENEIKIMKEAEKWKNSY